MDANEDDERAIGLSECINPTLACEHELHFPPSYGIPPTTVGGYTIARIIHMHGIHVPLHFYLARQKRELDKVLMAKVARHIKQVKQTKKETAESPPLWGETPWGVNWNKRP